MKNLYPWYSKLCIIFINKCQKEEELTTKINVKIIDTIIAKTTVKMLSKKYKHRHKLKKFLLLFASLKFI